MVAWKGSLSLPLPPPSQRTVIVNQHLELEALHHAHLQAGFADPDASFFAGRRLAEIEATGRTRGHGGRMTVETRRHFETLLLTAREQVAAVRERLKLQWSSLSEKEPSPGKVVECARQLSNSIEDVHASFGVLLELAPRSALLLAEYAAFLGDVINDQDRSLALKACCRLDALMAWRTATHCVPPYICAPLAERCRGARR